MPERNDPYVSLRNRDFLWFVASTVAFTLGTMIQATVVAWQVYALTRDPLSLGLVGLAEALPFIGAALYAGHVADRHNRKHLSLLSIGVQTLAALILLAYTVRPEVLAGGILLRAMVPLRVAPKADLAGRNVLIVSGHPDPIIPPSNSAALTSMLQNAGAEVEHRTLPVGHQLAQADLTLATQWLERQSSVAAQ